MSAKDIKLHAIQISSKDTDFFMNNQMKNQEEQQEKTIDVIIPTYHPDHKFDLLMKRLNRQTVRPNHIIILNTVPEASNTPQGRKEQEEYLRKYQEQYDATIVHINQKEFDHGATRGYGASLSEADFILFMTQDAIPADDSLIEEIQKPFANPEVAAAYARQLAHTNSDEIETFTRNFSYPPVSRIKSKEDMEELGIKTFFCSNVCACYRRKIYEELGGFVKHTIFNEDMIFASKVIDANLKIAYVAEAKVYHSHHYTYKQQFTRNFDLAVSQKQYSEVFDRVKSESEGMKLVKMTAKYLINRRSYFKLLDLFCLSGFKYMGYWFGKHYESLPKSMVVKCSMNKNYWKSL